MINVAVVGLGFMGVTHLKTYLRQKDARIVAVCDAIREPQNGVLASVVGNVADPDPVRLDMTQVKLFKNFDELLAQPGIDLIDLCVPTPLHAVMAIAALRSGRHVICEKPLARGAKVAREIAAAAARAKGFFMPAMCMRFWPGWSWLKEAVREQTYGRVLSARFRRLSEPPLWGKASYFKGDESGGALFDLHIHDTDFVQFLFGRPQSVFSTGLTRYSGAVDHVLTQYQVAGGATVSAEGTWLMGTGFGFNMSYTVIFENASVDYDLARGAEALRIHGESQRLPVIPPHPVDGYAGELGHMLECIQAGRPPSVVTAAEGVSSIEIAEAEEESVKTRRVVTL